MTNTNTQQQKTPTLEGQTKEPTQIIVIDHIIIRDRETGGEVLNKRG